MRRERKGEINQEKKTERKKMSKMSIWCDEKDKGTPRQKDVKILMKTDAYVQNKAIDRQGCM